MGISKVTFDKDESNFIRVSLEEYLVNLKINDGSKSRIQKIQQIIDKMPAMEKNWVSNGK
jgi:hypothetical protein|tara:strand:- start:2841 stop:3020 length:180 start_codon:yes stop_codon:yes gene_type:complete